MACVVAVMPDAASAQAEIEDIIVTAERRAQNLQRVPAQVIALDADDIVRTGMTASRDLARAVPGFTLVQSGPNPQFYINGVGSGIANAYADPSVAFNVDGIYQARATGTNGYFFDLERIEVLKGPQGTLYGRNATAGAINVITAKPVQRFAASASTEIGNYSALKLNGMLNVPLGDTLAVRVAGQTVRHDGYYTDGYDDADDKAARAHLLWEPASDISLLATFDYTHQGGRGGAGGPIAYPFVDPDNPWVGPTDPRQGASIIHTNPTVPVQNLPITDDKGYNNNTNYGWRGELNWGLGWANLTAIGSIRKTKVDALQWLNGFSGTTRLSSNQKAAELRLASPTSQRFVWLVGIYGFTEHVNSWQYTNRYFRGYNLSVLPRLDNDQWAVFMQNTFNVTGSLRLTAGVRYTYDKKEQQGTNTATPTIGGVVTTVANSGSASWEAVTGKIGVELDVGERSMIYASVAKGFKAGGFISGGPPNTYRPEKITSYNIGTKNRFFDNSLQLNAEAFYWDYRDRHQNATGAINPPPNIGGIVANLNKTHMAGVSLDMIWTPVANGTFSANVQFLEAVFDDAQYENLTAPSRFDCPATRNATNTAWIWDCSGFDAPQAPRWAGTVAYRHTFELASSAKVDASVATRFASAQWVGLQYIPELRQKAFHMTDIFVTYTSADGRWSLGGFVYNLENEAVKSSISGVSSITGVAGGALQPPRTYGMRVAVNF